LIQPLEKPEVAKSEYKVAMPTGCVQDLVFSDINRSTVNVLKHNGCEVHTPPLQSCCGSLHAHNGDRESAIMLARRAIEQINPFEYDAIISNAGGCGSHLRAYGHLLQDDPDYAERAAEWSRKTERYPRVSGRNRIRTPQSTSIHPEHIRNLSRILSPVPRPKGQQTAPPDT
jgi:glycolate oxidase iron-sulfur subunit